MIIERYNSKWSEFFEIESQRIKSVMGESLQEIHHIGSTSIPYLSAKPIIDIILVTKDLEVAKGFLISKDLEYRYKGEYNLPLRDLYGKKEEFEIYLHVHLAGSSEIELNLKFRDYLRSNEVARSQYEKIKIAASKDKNAWEKVETGITRYNLLKNKVIVSILKEAGFTGVCERFVTHGTETEFFNSVKRKQSCLQNKDIEQSKKIVQYRGTDLVGAAELINVSSDKILLNFAWTNNDAELMKQLMFKIERWVRIRLGAELINR